MTKCRSFDSSHCSSLRMTRWSDGLGDVRLRLGLLIHSAMNAEGMRHRVGGISSMCHIARLAGQDDFEAGMALSYRCKTT